MDELPAVLANMHVFAVLTEGRGARNLTLKVVDAAEAQGPLIEEDIEVEFHSPLETVDVIIRFEHIAFPSAGGYRVQLFSGPALLAERRIVIDLLEMPNGD